jgi:site-specific DNA-methyltransferase (adenine-specific)
LFACVPWCVVRGLADANGTKKSGTGAVKRKPKDSNIYGADEGTVDRFFPTFSWTADDLPMFYATKVSPAERDEGLTAKPGEKRANHHPCVKPLSLMRWVCRLVAPPGGVILDPFMGSGSTGCAAVLEGFRFIGVEREVAYIEIAKARINYWSCKKKGEAVNS